MDLSFSALRTAANGLVEAALLGAAWEEPMMAFATAAGADGSTLVRDGPPGRGRNGARSTSLLTTRSIASAVSRYLDGQAPPDPRLARVSPGLTQGFVTDLDCFTATEIASSPFYQEFLRSEGLQWHGCCRLAGTDAAPQIYLSLKRAADRSHYERRDIRALNGVVPILRAAAKAAEAVFEAESRERGRLLSEGDRAVIELDESARILRANGAADRVLCRGLAQRGARLAAPQAEEQPRLDATLARVLGPERECGIAVLSAGSENARLLLRILPVTGAARDVFLGISAIVIVTRLCDPGAPSDLLVNHMRRTFGLTPAEARVSFLIGQGVSLARTARRLGLSEGTARNYLKAALAKTGTGRQAELAVLLTRLLD